MVLGIGAQLKADHWGQTWKDVITLAGSSLLFGLHDINDFPPLSPSTIYHFFLGACGTWTETSENVSQNKPFHL